MRFHLWGVVAALLLGACGESDQPMGPFDDAGAAVTCVDCLLASSVAAGGESTCAIGTDGRAWCWGYGEQGVLGSPPPTMCRDGRNTWGCALRPQLVPGLGRVAAFSLGGAHSCALLEDATIRCWGFNPYGGLGDGTNVTRLDPTPVRGVDSAIAVSAGVAHTCALLRDGTARCWGVNSFGQVGDGTTANRNIPGRVGGIADAREIATGAGSTCARLGSGAVSCWGWNQDGQLGDGTNTNRPTPVAVSAINGATGVSVGSRHACALLGDGSVSCWGFNIYGQLGDGTTVTRNAPVRVVGLTGVVEVAAGAFYTCARVAGGRVYCWGAHDLEQLGATPATRCSFGGIERPCSLVPVLVEGVTSASQLVAGSAHACARGGDGSVRCWGWNRNGQLGDGTTTGRVAPRIVRP